MTPKHPDPPDALLPPAPPEREGKAEVRSFLGSAVPFVLVGLVLYGLVLAGSEWLVYEHGLRNPFFKVHTAEHAEYDHVILGASHAAVFDYRDMNQRLEEATGARVLNLATVGAGITINHLLYDYFSREHRADHVVYILDSFAFYSPEWNEERLQDASLFARAPWDPTLAWLLLRRPDARGMALDYVFGFSKINNADRFEPDLFEAEGSRFERTYRPIPQIDRQRIEYLYPDPDAMEPATLDESPYLEEFQELIRSARERGAGFVVIRPPIPERMQEMIPGEEHFARTIDSIARLHDVEYHDFSSVNNDEEYFYDSDHLNREGTLRFIEEHLADVLAVSGEPDVESRPGSGGTGRE